VSYDYDFSYGNNGGLLAKYTRKRSLSGPIGSARPFTYQYSLDYATERGKMLGYTVSKTIPGEGRYTNYDLAPKWYVPLRVKTDSAGHTPGPSDIVHALVLTDFVQDSSKKQKFTYKITIEAGDQKKVITSVDPGPHWYRPDPNVPTYTITAVLDGRAETETPEVTGNGTGFGKAIRRMHKESIESREATRRRQEPQFKVFLE